MGRPLADTTPLPVFHWSAAPMPPKSVTVIHSDTTLVEEWLGRLRDGDDSARDVLIEHSCERLRVLISHTLNRKEPFLRSIESTDDVLQEVLLRLHQALKDVAPASPREYAGLAAMEMRREMIDLARKHRGPHSYAANTRQAENSELQREAEPIGDDIWTIEDWTSFHEAAEQLGTDHRAVVDLLWYQNCTQQQAAEALGVSRQTLIRRWRAACVELMRTVDAIPGRHVQVDTDEDDPA